MIMGLIILRQRQSLEIRAVGKVFVVIFIRGMVDGSVGTTRNINDTDKIIIFKYLRSNGWGIDCSRVGKVFTRPWTILCDVRD